MEESKPVLDVSNACVSYDSPAGAVQAVSDISLQIFPNTIVGLVGESGSGKSTFANMVMRLLKNNARVTQGSVNIAGHSIYSMDKNQLRKFRWNRMSMVFQSAMSALNPVLNIEQQIVDVFKSHRPDMSKREMHKHAEQLLEMVSIDRKYLRSFPHELSGGMKQRIVIAIAIALQPDLVIMDEPTTALDVVVQRSILDQIKEIQEERKFAILFISHDFSLVADLASEVAIMYAGRIVEKGDSKTMLTSEGHHPYTQGLMRAIPKLTAEEVTIEGIPGNPPNLIDLPPGCAYHPRCPLATDVCRTERPARHKTAVGEMECHYANQIGERGDVRV